MKKSDRRLWKGGKVGLGLWSWGKVPAKRQHTPPPKAHIVEDEPSDVDEQENKEESENHLNLVQEPERLEPEPQKLGTLKSNDIHIADILTNDEEDEDLEDSWGDKAKIKNIPIGWVVVATLILLFAVGKSVLLIIEGSASSETEKIINVDILRKEKKEVNQVRLALQNTIRSYLAADTIEEKIKWSRAPERVRPLMEHYYQSHNFTPLEFDHIDSINFATFWGRPFALLIARTPDGKGKFITLEQTGKLSFRIDWETDIYYLPMTWQDFRTQKPTSPTEMRVRVKPDTFYAFQFRDESKYECFRLTSRDDTTPVYGYVKRGSRTWKDLRYFFELRSKSDKQGEPLMLKLRYPEATGEATSPQGVIIEQFTSDRWLKVDRPSRLPTNSKPVTFRAVQLGKY